MKNYKIAVAGTGYVGLSLSVLLAQHNQVTAVDIVQAKVDMINIIIGNVPLFIFTATTGTAVIILSASTKRVIPAWTTASMWNCSIIRFCKS